MVLSFQIWLIYLYLVNGENQEIVSPDLKIGWNNHFLGIFNMSGYQW